MGPERGDPVILRALCALFSAGAFTAAAALTGRLGRPLPAMVFSCGLVVHLIASFALLQMHRTDRRPAWEPVLFLLLPAAAWWALGGPAAHAARPFWTFLGAFQFVAVTGGFVLGVFLSPLAAVARGLDAGAAAAGLRFGFAHLRRFRAPQISMAVLFGAATAGLAALAVHAARACGVAALPAASQAAVALLAVLATGGVAALAYRHTLFGMLESASAGRRRSPWDRPGPSGGSEGGGSA